MALATYDTTNKIVILDQVAPDGNNQVQLSVIELYSDAKGQWLSDLALNRFVFPWIAIGGQPLPGGAVAPRIYFLRDPWQIRPYEADHDLTLRTNLFTENGIAVTVPTIGDYTVNSNIISEFSSGDDRVNDLLKMILDLWRLAGADISNPLFVPAGVGTITAADIAIGVTGDCNTGHTLERQ